MAEEGPNTTTTTVSESAPNPEVVARAARRHYTAGYKLQILEELDEHKDDPGYVGAVLRREGLYSSNVSAWREQRRQGALKALGKARGREGQSAVKVENERLQAELAQAKRRLEQLEAMLDVQKKCLLLLGLQDPQRGGC